MNLPECADLKKKYDDCLKVEWARNMRTIQPIQCDESFQDYKDCAIVVMQNKIKKDTSKAK